MKVIFLDFDGVLNSAEYRNSVDDYYSNFIDERKLELLALLVREYNDEIVLTVSGVFIGMKARCRSIPTAAVSINCLQNTA